MSAPHPDSMANLVAIRTLDKYENDYFPKRDRITIAFRGDLAEQFKYDKIRPLSPAQRHGHRVVIEAESQKTGTTGRGLSLPPLAGPGRLRPLPAPRRCRPPTRPTPASSRPSGHRESARHAASRTGA